MGSMLEFYQQSEQYKDKVNFDVIRFIDEVASFPDYDGKVSSNIAHLFCNGYCFYFANMLKLAFGGRVCWVEDRGHVVWTDCAEDCSWEELQSAIAYDVTGVFYDYEYLWPIEYLGDTVVDYMHNGKEFHLSPSFKDWCDFCGTSEILAVSSIWERIPRQYVMRCYESGMDLVATVYQYWKENEYALRGVLTGRIECFD